MTLRRRAASFIAFSCLTALAACGGGTDDDGASAAHTGREGDGWTVLVYSMADTNLEPFMVTDINEAGEVGSSEHLQVRAFVDRSPGYGDDELLDQGTWVGGRVLDLGEPGTSEVVEDLGDVNSADPQVLADFITQGIEDHRAGHYALVISDHGAGWPGIGPDETSDYDTLGLEELVAGVSAGLEAAGVDKLDLLGFDACLMANYEVASAVAPLADRMVASQELEPGHGWDYRSLQTLADDPDADADDFGSAIIDGFQAQAGDQGTDADITLAMVDLTRMDRLDEAVAGFADGLESDAVGLAPLVGRAEATALGFGKSPDAAQDSNLSDLGQVAASIGDGEPSLSDAADEVTEALQDVVLDGVTGEATAGATGLSIYLPPFEEVANGEYLDVDSADVWGEFLVSYFDAGASIPEAEYPEFLAPQNGPEVTLDDDGTLAVEASFADAALDNLTGATISYGFLNDDGSVTYFGEEVADVDDESAIALGTYDLTALTMSDGEDEAFAYVDLDLNEDYTVGFIDVPMTYYASYDPEVAQDALLSAVIDVESGEFISETLYAYDDQTGGYGELAADPEGILVPDVLTYSADGEPQWEPTSDVGLYADVANLTYTFTPLDSGTPLQIDLSVSDFGGNTATTSTVVEVP
ncbi:clostripain-related cysteine peptidase [Nocardioides sp. R-C-SC26]|uniref:clostripain-related cysteine peptidase n=1 Tax=Nocardioides sp. R-C-SC26 TaxID=2870414 RepID=UPI001E47EBE3|nr:clostripain-related cysteine peptidase [Nocardioides sp. R-C-SC26]